MIFRTCGLGAVGLGSLHAASTVALMRARRDWSFIVAAVAFLSVAALALVGRASTPPLLPGTRECTGFPAEKCDELVASLEEEAAPHGGLSAYRIVCTSATCTDQEGQGIFVVVYGDGRVEDYARGYSVPGEAPSSPVRSEPSLTVAPACVGVPQLWCEEFARTLVADEVREGQVVASVTAECLATCTEESGDVRVRIELTDGTVLASDGFSYRSP